MAQMWQWSAIKMMTGDMSYASVAKRMSELLGTSEPPSEKVMTAALADPLYAHHLLTCKGNHLFLRVLLDNPPDVGAEPVRSNATLVAMAAKALFHWARTGFATVDDDIFEKRINACHACPDLAAPTNQLVYRAIEYASTDEDNRICRACGCIAVKKARLPFENCPLPDSENGVVSRWGEPFS